MSIPIFLREKSFRSMALAAGAAGAATALVALVPFSAYAASLSIQSLSPGSSVDAGEPVSFSVGESGFTNPTYGVSDSFGGSTVVTGDIGSSTGVFSWTPQESDAGVHVLTVNASDADGDAAATAVGITVNPSPSVTIQSLSPSAAITAGTPLTFTAAAEGFTDPQYSVSDSFSGSSVVSGDLNSSGVFNWTPNANDIGTHTLTVTVSDSLGHQATATQSVTVAAQSLAIQSLSPSDGSVVAGNSVTFMAAASGLNDPVYSVSDSFGGSTLTDGDINTSTGAFSWVPAESDAGSHTLTVKATDAYGNSTATSFAVTVEPNNSGTTTPTGLTSAQTGFVNRFIRDLYVGLQGSDVRELQQLLSDQGLYTGPITGYFGSQTQGAVGRFQQMHGLPQVGQVGPQTLSALNGVLESLNTLSSTLTQPQSTSTSTSSPWGWRWSLRPPMSVSPFPPFGSPVQWGGGSQRSWNLPFMNGNDASNFSNYSDNDDRGRGNR